MTYDSIVRHVSQVGKEFMRQQSHGYDKRMRNMDKITIIAAVATALAACGGQRLTEAEVRRVMGNMEASVKRHDAAGLTANFAPHALIMVSLPGTDGGLRRMSVDEYKAMLEGLWKVQLQSSYEVSQREVTLAANGRSATARDIAKEVVLLPGERMVSVSKQKAEIALVEGEPKIVSLTAQVDSLVATPTGRD